MFVSKVIHGDACRYATGVIVIASIALTGLPASAGGKADLPGCRDPRVIDAAVAAMEDTYYRVGVVFDTMLEIVKTSLRPSWLANTDKMERAAARAIGYGAEHVRLCLAEIDESSRIAVQIVTDPRDHSKWIAVVSNIGIGDAVAESLPQLK